MERLQKSSDKNALKWLTARGKTARLWIGLAVGAGCTGGLLLVVQARLLSLIIHNTFMEGALRQTLTPVFTAAIGVVLLRAALVWARAAAGFNAGAAVRREIRMAVMKHLTALGPVKSSGLQTGALAAAAMEQVEGLHDFFAHYLPQIAVAAAVPAAIAAFVFPVSWAAAVILLATAPMIPLFMILVGMGAESISQRHFQALSQMSGHFLDVLRGLPTLKLLGRSRAQTAEIARVSAEYRRRTMSVLRIAFLSSAVLEFFSAVAMALVAVYLGMRFLGYIDFGSYDRPLLLSGGLFILILAPDFYAPMRELGTYYHARANAVGAAKEIQKIFTIDTPKAPVMRLPDPAAHFSRIQFNAVKVAFDNGRRKALTDATFHIDAGCRVALVGASGAGKSTILNLLLKFMDTDGGEILVDQTPLTHYSPESWRRCLAWIGQHPVLFYGTLRENIRLGKPDASNEQIVRAARLAQVTEFSSALPKGLDTLVGEGGYGLSRGQAQRVALARTFIKEAPILLLDEPTSGLDGVNARLVMAALAQFSRDRTMIMASHRLTHLKHFDLILVLDEGKIVEQGTYNQLMDQKGYGYRLLYSAPEEAVG